MEAKYNTKYTPGRLKEKKSPHFKSCVRVAGFKAPAASHMSTVTADCVRDEKTREACN